MDRPINLAAVLLAAGPSTRLGRPKQLVDVNGEKLVRRVARLLLELDMAPVCVVSGCEAEAVESALAGLQAEVVYNRNWQLGMGASIACGARKVPGYVDGLLIAVCDQWKVESDDYQRLISAWKNDISRITVAEWKEGQANVSGPPVIFPRNVIPELKGMIENRGARQVIDRNMDIVEFVEMPDAAFDLDRPEDLAKIDQR
jgi:CTP:molybdopterin cytidylyltransferase MocA